MITLYSAILDFYEYFLLLLITGFQRDFTWVIDSVCGTSILLCSRLHPFLSFYFYFTLRRPVYSDGFPFRRDRLVSPSKLSSNWPWVSHWEMIIVCDTLPREELCWPCFYTHTCPPHVHIHKFYIYTTHTLTIF